MHAVVGNDRIEATLGGRTFGTPTLGNDVFEQDVPEVFRSLALDLQDRSALLALQASVELTRDNVIEAYRADITLLGERVGALEKCVLLAIRCSIFPRHRANQLARRDDFQKEADRLWQEIQQEVPSMGRQSLLRLDSDLAAKQPVHILDTLQRQFKASVRRIPQLFACWLQLLVEKELIGLIEWTDVDVGRYHYFKRARQEDTLREHVVSDSVEHDPSQLFGSRNIYRTVIDKTARIRHFSERHVHHIVRSRADSLEEYSQKVPSYVADLIDGLPAFMRPLCEIVSGDITHEEIVRWTAKDEVSIIRDESVWKGSPALALGGIFALAGWSSDDMRGETRHFSSQKVREKMQEGKRELLALAVIVGLLMAMLAGFITWVVHNQSDAAAAAQEEYQSYQDTIPRGLRTYKATQFEPLALQGDSDPVLFGHAHEVMYGDKRWKLTLQRGVMPEKPLYVATFDVPSHNYVGAYGDVDLMPRLGVPATLHVLGIEGGRFTSDSSVLKYKITYRKDK
jgi:hypothetical protein